MIRETVFTAVPVLLTAAAFLSGARRLGLVHRFGVRAIVITCAAALVAALAPVRGLSLADICLTLSPSFSVTSCVFALAVFWRQAGGAPLFRREDVLLLSGITVAVSILLFSSTLGIVRTDIYALGYGFSPVVLLFSAGSVLSVAFRTRLRYLFVACLGAHAFALYPSGNLFDTVTDGPAFCMAIVVLALSARGRTAGLRKAETAGI